MDTRRQVPPVADELIDKLAEETESGYDVVPAWLPNRLSRLVKTPKRCIIDPALVGVALRRDARSVLRDGHLLVRATMTGT